MDVRERNSALTNEQSWGPRLLAASGFHGSCFIQGAWALRSCCSRVGWPGIGGTDLGVHSGGGI